MTAQASAFIDLIVLFQKNAYTDTVTKQIKEAFLRRCEDHKKLPYGTDEQIVDYFLQNISCIMSSDKGQEDGCDRDYGNSSARALAILVLYLSNNTRTLKRFNSRDVFPSFYMIKIRMRILLKID